jgi:hypothetical protein
MFGYIPAALVTALILALCLKRLLAECSGSRGWVWYFSTIFLSSWTAGVWVRPAGPAVAGIYPIPVLFTGVAVGCLWIIAQGTMAGSARECQAMGMITRVNRQNQQNQMRQGTSRWAWAFFTVLTGLVIWAGHMY